MINTKVLVWTRTHLYTPSGSPAVIRKVLSHFNPDNIVYCCDVRPGQTVDDDLGIRIRNYSWIDRRLVRFFRKADFLYRLFIKTPLLVVLGIYNVIRLRPKKILTIYFGVEWICSAWLVSKLTGVSLSYYCHDPFKEKFENRKNWIRKWVGRIERITLRSSNVIVLYDSLGNLYKEIYGIDSGLLPHVIDPSPTEAPVKEDETLHIGFAGSIYDNNKDLIESLVEFVDQRKPIRLRLYGVMGEGLKTWMQNKLGERVSISFVSGYSELLDKLSKCDILYLPLSFTGSRDLPRKCLQYVIPTKVIDYLNTGVPILLHCPADYALYDFLKQFDNAFWIENFEDPSLESVLSVDTLKTKRLTPGTDVHYPKEMTEEFFENQLINLFAHGNAQ